MRLLLMAAALAATAPYQAAAAQPVGAEAAAALHQRALDLARVVQSPARAVDGALVVLDRQAVDGLLTNPDIAAAEAEHPGLAKALWAATRPVLKQQLSASLPSLWQALAGVYEKQFTLAELGELTLFYDRGPGSKLLDATAAQADLSPMMRDVMQQKNGEIEADTYTKTVSAAASRGIATLSPAERSELARFMASPSGSKLLTVAQEVTKVSVEWMNRQNPEDERKVEKVMLDALEKFIAAEGAADK